MKTFISIILLCLFMMSPALAQSVEMADVMRSNGKIYVVVAVIAIIFIGLMVYLVCMDKRVKKLEEK